MPREMTTVIYLSNIDQGIRKAKRELLLGSRFSGVRNVLLAMRTIDAESFRVPAH
jgi:hypothetical protein